MFSYLMQTPLFYYIKCFSVIQTKSGIVFPLCLFFNFRAKNYTDYIGGRIKQRASARDGVLYP
jgi:hypothetical protein